MICLVAFAALLLGSPARAQSPFIVNDTDPSITYGGASWGYYSGRATADFGKDVHATSSNGSFASYTFTGTAVSYFTEIAPDEGNVQVYLDGTLQTTVNCYSAARQVRQAVWSSGTLASGSHTLKLVKMDGGFLLLDALQITTPGPVNDTDPGLFYSGAGWGYFRLRGIGDFRDDVTATYANGDSVSYTFTGTGIGYVTELASDEGNVQVYLDGTLQATVNCYSATRKVQQTVWSIAGLGSGSHTLKLVKVDGGYMVLDILQLQAAPVLTSIAVSPASATLTTGGTQTFTAVAKDQNGAALTTQPAFTWTVTGVGTVTSAGIYSAGSTAGSATVKATSGTVSGTASVNVATGISLSLITAVNNQASLSWSGVSGATSYNVKRSTTNGSGYTTIGSGNSTTYLDQGLTNGTPYYYIVTAVNGTTESAPSNQVSATPVAQAFGFLNVGNGSVLSGQVTLYVSMASKAYGSEASPVTFSVDGVVYDTGGDEQITSGNAGANTFFSLATDALANGPHTLKVQDVNGNIASLNVTFSNVLFNLSIPNMFDVSGGDGLPTSAAIVASLTSAQPWTVSIVSVDSAHSVIQSFNGNSANINVVWNGKNAQGFEADDNAYEVNISYGASQSAAASPQGASPLIATKPIIRHNLLSKNKIGDCFVMLEQGVFPSYADMIAYLIAIKNDLGPTQGNVWNKFSFISHATLSQPNFTPAEIQRIDNHFKTRLAVFYVDSHGGIGTPGNGNGTFFRIGGHSWRSGTFSGPASSGMATLTQSANYGVNDPPALVFIDSCDSASANPGHPYGPDLGFSDDFGIGNGPSGFLGWNGFAVPYGAAAAPYDDWTFWRLDLWAQFTNFNITYDKAYSNLLRDYNVHGRRGG